MPWSHLSHALVAGTGQSTAHSWLLWMFIFENYADPSLDRHRRLIGMRPGTRFFTYGMNGLEILLQMPTSTHGLPSLAKITGIWQNMLPVCLSIGGFNVCSPGILLALDVWAVPRNTWDSKLDAYCRYANLGYWRDAALDDSLWNSHLDSFVDFCRM